MNNRSFSDNCESSTHDSDITPLTFVVRSNVTGGETPVADIALSDGREVDLNMTTGDSSTFIMTKPFEVRNRNKVCFNVKLTPPADTVGPGPSQPVVVPLTDTFPPRPIQFADLGTLVSDPAGSIEFLVTYTDLTTADINIDATYLRTLAIAQGHGGESSAIISLAGIVTPSDGKTIDTVVYYNNTAYIDPTSGTMSLYLDDTLLIADGNICDSGGSGSQGPGLGIVVTTGQNFKLNTTLVGSVSIPVPGVQNIMHGDATWGFTSGGTIQDTTPAFLKLPTSQILGTDFYVKDITLTVITPFSGGALTGLTGAIGLDTDNLFLGADLTTAGTYNMPVNYSVRCQSQQLTFRLFSSGDNINAATAGQFTITMTFESRTPDNSAYYNTSSFNFESAASKTIVFGSLPVVYAVLTEVRAVVITRATYDGPSAFTMRLDSNTSSDNILPPFDITMDSSMGAYSSGPIHVIYNGTHIAPLKVTVDASSIGGDLTDLHSDGLVRFEFYYEVPESTPFTWSAGDTLSVVAFASLDNLQYVPIALVRHDWSNTPKAEVIKFTDIAIPDSFDPGDSFLNLPNLDHVAFRNSIMLYLADFDNVSTWNYIRLLPVWHFGEASNNGDVKLSIVANAREL